MLNWGSTPIVRTIGIAVVGAGLVAEASIARRRCVLRKKNEKRKKQSQKKKDSPPKTQAEMTGRKA